MSKSLQPPLVQVKERIKKLESLFEELLNCADLNEDSLDPHTIILIEDIRNVLEKD